MEGKLEQSILCFPHRTTNTQYCTPPYPLILSLTAPFTLLLPPSPSFLLCPHSPLSLDELIKPSHLPLPCPYFMTGWDNSYKLCFQQIYNFLVLTRTFVKRRSSSSVSGIGNFVFVSAALPPPPTQLYTPLFLPLGSTPPLPSSVPSTLPMAETYNITFTTTSQVSRNHKWLGPEPLSITFPSPWFTRYCTHPPSK